MSKGKRRLQMQRRMSEQEYIAHLERENEELKLQHNMAAQIIRQVQASGQLQIAFDDSLPKGTKELVVPLSMVERARAEANEHAYRLIKEWVFGAQIPTLDALHDLDAQVREVAAAGAVGHGEELREALRGKDEKLTAVYAAYVRETKRLAEVTGAPIPDRLAEIGQIVAQLVTAVQACQIGQDNGEALRAFILERKHTWQARVLAAREKLSRGGAPPGLRSWTALIGQRALELEQEYPDLKGPQIAEKMIAELDAYRQLRPLTYDEGMALDRLQRAYNTRYTNSGRLKGLLRRAKKAVGEQAGQGEN